MDWPELGPTWGSGCHRDSASSRYVDGLDLHRSGGLLEAITWPRLRISHTTREILFRLLPCGGL